MTTEHDFQKALRQHEYTTFPPELEAHHNAVSFSLRLADKLLKQEPSEGMTTNGTYAAAEVRKDGDLDYYSTVADKVFTAMIEQAVKEIENDK